MLTSIFYRALKQQTDRDQKSQRKTYLDYYIAGLALEREKPEDEMNAAGRVNLQKLEEEIACGALDEIAALMRTLTYGEMIELAEGLCNVNVTYSALDRKRRQVAPLICGSGKVKAAGRQGRVQVGIKRKVLSARPRLPAGRPPWGLRYRGPLAIIRPRMLRGGVGAPPKCKPS